MVYTTLVSPAVPQSLAVLVNIPHFSVNLVRYSLTPFFVSLSIIVPPHPPFLSLYLSLSLDAAPAVVQCCLADLVSVRNQL